MKRWTRSVFVALLSVAVFIGGEVFWADERPLTVEELKTLAAGGVTERRLLDLVKEKGIGFSPTAEVLDDLRRGGVPEAVLKEMTPQVPPGRRVNDDIEKGYKLERDLLSVEARERFHLRHFSLAHLSNANASEEELQKHRVALAKLLNSLSWRPRILKPKAIDQSGTLFRIDLRDYDWDERTWKQIEKAYPYFTFRPEYGRILGLSASRVPYVRADWFVANASLPPLYHGILPLPPKLAALERELGIDTQRDLRREKFVARGEVRNSGVSRNNRVLERHETGYGAFWVSFDFRSSTGQQNIFEHPLDFRPNGVEIIFNLPNGLQAYFFADGQGNRIDRAPADIVFDRNDPDSAEIVNGRSCMSCHEEGIKTFQDEVRAVVLRNPPARIEKRLWRSMSNSFRWTAFCRRTRSAFEQRWPGSGRNPPTTPPSNPSVPSRGNLTPTSA